MNVAILILDGVLKSVAYGMEEMFKTNNLYCKSKFEPEMIVKFVGDSEHKYFDLEPLSYDENYDIVLIVPTTDKFSFNVSDEVLKWLRFQHSKRAILASACVGSFILAKTGLLDGKSATTHWIYEEKFKREFPNIKLDIDKILIDEKSIITAGGINAYLDLCLYIIEKFHSNKTASQLANLMIIDRSRVSQKSYKSFSTIFLYDDEEIKNITKWMSENLNRQICIETLAKRLNLTQKTFIRRFNRALNISPIKHLTNLRVEKAKELLISTNKSFSDITFEVGYIDESSFRKLFKKETSLSPIEYRKKFQQRLG